MAKDAIALALGTFDGMHLGHCAVIARAVSIAREHGWKSAVYTFSNHPRSVLGAAPALLTAPEEKRRLLKALGVDEVIMTAFTRAVADMPPEDFLNDLAARYTLRALIAGSDFRYGRAGAGDMAAMRAFGCARGILVAEVPFVTLNGEKISSTRLRAALAAGDTDLAARLMGRAVPRP